MSDAESFFSNVYGRYAKEYASWFLLMLSNPKGTVVLTREVHTANRQGEYLLIIVVISVFIGATIGALIPNRPPFSDRLTIFVVVSFLWIFLSFFIHGFCKLLGGKENMIVTLSVMIQILAFVYTISNFITLLSSWLGIEYSPIRVFFSSRSLWREPGAILFSIQFLMLLYLVPVTICYAHEFRGVRLYAVAVFAASFAIFFGVPVFALGGC